MSVTPPLRRPGIVSRTLTFISGGAHPDLAGVIAERLGVPVTPQTAHTFANGECFVRYDVSVRGTDAFVLQTPAAPLNTWLMEQLVMIDALKRASARHITAILPFYPYSRQDKKHSGREPISARLVADLLATAGADRLITVDLHTAQTQGFFHGPVDHLEAQPLLAEALPDRDVTVVAPDSGRVKLAERWADLLGGRPLAFVQHRAGLTTARPPDLVGEVRGRACVVVDDMIDTGATMAGAARLLLDAGATHVTAAATHGVFSGNAPNLLAYSGIHRVVVTDTLPIPPRKRFPQLRIQPIGPLLADAIREVFTAGSVSRIFTAREW